MGRETMRGRAAPVLPGATGSSSSRAWAARSGWGGGGAAARTSPTAAAKGPPWQPAATSIAPAVAAASRNRATGGQPTPVSALHWRRGDVVQLVREPLGHRGEIRLAGDERAV